MAKFPFLIGLSCLAWFSAPAFAEDQPTGPAEPGAAPEETIQNLSIDGLAAILTEAGAEDVTQSDADKVVRFKSGGRNYVVSLSVCEEATGLCSVVTIGRGIKAKLPIEVLNKLNLQYNGLLTATRLSDTTFRMVHATVLGGGVLKSNVAVNLVWYVNETPQFEAFIKSQLVAEAFGRRPDIQNVSENSKLPLGDIVLSAEEMSTLAGTLGTKPSGTRMQQK